MRVAVVGAGVHGAAAARALVKRGHEVVVHEQFALGHRHGSSHGASRIYRLAYPEEAWVRLAREAIAGWRALEAETGEHLLESLGLVELADPEASSEAALAAAGAAFERLSPADLGERFPTLSWPAGAEAVFQPEAGILRADRAHTALLRGLDVREESRVRPDELDADAVVVTAGAWARDLLGLPLAVTSETVCYFELGEAPPSVVEFEPGTRRHAFYALHDPGGPGLKAGLHMGGRPCDPDDRPEPDPNVVGRVTDWVRDRLPEAGRDPVAVETCLYATTPDESFILERRGRIVVGSACSGHGFKFAPAVAERLADLVET